MLVQCWDSVEDGGPALNQYRSNASCFLGYMFWIRYSDWRSHSGKLSSGPGGGGGGVHTWEYWGCAAWQTAFLSFKLWHRVSFLSFRKWDRVLFWASNSEHPLSMYFADFSGHYQPNSITFFSLIASKCYKQILNRLKRPWNMQYIGSNYTIRRSIKFCVNLQIGTGCLFSRVIRSWFHTRYLDPVKPTQYIIVFVQTTFFSTFHNIIRHWHIIILCM